MIKVKLLNGQSLVINAELIEAVESAHDTIITLTTGRKFTVQDTSDEVIEKVVSYRRLMTGQYGGS
jgi:flagellar protein FlbD